MHTREIKPSTDVIILIIFRGITTFKTLYISIYIFNARDTITVSVETKKKRNFYVLNAANFSIRKHKILND